MWESAIHTSRRGNSLRRILAYALSAFIAAFLWILVINPSVHAATSASWSGSNISYDGQTYVPAKATSSTKPSLTPGTTYYLWSEFTMTGQRAHAIYFPNGSPTTATSATYTIYDVNGDGTYGNQISNSDISITSQAQSAISTDATWKNGVIAYAGKTYTGNGSAPFISTGKNPPLKSGAKYYQMLDVMNNKAYLIYFSASADPPTATSATYQTYDISGGGDALQWSNPSAAKTISITPVNGTSSTSGDGTPATDTSTTSCAVEGIGWIVCPVSNFLATGMDNIFNMLKGFLVVKPLATQTDSPLYQGWNYIRSFANVAFVIAFLIIIYSQLTNLGITNYSIKKLLPRLIVAAILVNISYYICAIAVDLSNVMGDSLQQLLIGMREHLTGPNTNNIASWQSVTGFVLSGGTAAAAAGVGIATLVIGTGASAGAALILLLPMLLALILAVLVALVVLAARQALIIIFIIGAPLAFVAYLLPNTEKWFEKWRGAFLTLLVFFPLFALIFGGSQLAGFLIIQNADQINIILLGMFVQVAPLVLTPLLVKFSGNIVGKIAGFVNDPKKGMLDRTRNWAKDRSEYLAARNMARTDPVRGRQVFRRYALSADQRKRIREGRKAMYGVRSDARWANSADFNAIDQEQRFAQDQKSLGENRSERQYTRSKNVAGAIRNLDFALNNVKVDIDTAKAHAESNWEASTDPRIAERRLGLRVANDRLATIKSTHDAEYEEFKAGRVGHVPANANVAQMLRQSQDDTRLLALNAIRGQFAKRVQQEALTQEYLTNSIMVEGQRIRQYAGGIHSQGAERVLAQALTEQHKARAESVANASAIIEHLNLNAAETAEIAKNISVKGIIVTEDIREAAIKRTGEGGVMPLIREVLQSLDLSPTGNENHRLALVEALRGNAGRQKFIGMGLLDQMTQGFAGAQNGVPDSLMDQWIAAMIIDGKLSAKELVSQDKDTLAHVSEAISRLPRTPALTIGLRQLKQEIADARSNAQMWNIAGERKPFIEDIDRKI